MTWRRGAVRPWTSTCDATSKYVCFIMFAHVGQSKSHWHDEQGQDHSNVISVPVHAYPATVLPWAPLLLGSTTSPVEVAGEPKSPAVAAKVPELEGCMLPLSAGTTTSLPVGPGRLGPLEGHGMFDHPCLQVVMSFLQAQVTFD